jgi:hypothetical protein
MKILAAYIREKSYIKKNTVTEDYEQQEKDKSLSTDIQVILTQFHNPVIFIIFFTGLLLSSKLVSSVR